VNVLASPLLYAARSVIIGRMRAARLPAIYEWPETTAEGGLLGYGPSIQLIDKVLHGAKPADLPIERPTKFEFVLNLRSADVLGVSVPASLLLRADEVIE
jgi:ABC-type uncharacterized transport system substrate-binding protein